MKKWKARIFLAGVLEAASEELGLWMGFEVFELQPDFLHLGQVGIYCLVWVVGMNIRFLFFLLCVADPLL